MEVTRRQFMRGITGMALAAGASRGEGVSPLRAAGILPARRGRDVLAVEDKGGTPSPRCLGTYPGEIVPLGDIRPQSKWSG